MKRERERGIERINYNSKRCALAPCPIDSSSPAFLSYGSRGYLEEFINSARLTVFNQVSKASSGVKIDRIEWEIGETKDRISKIGISE